MRVWTYVIANDRGSAPNYYKPAVTLAVCKPSIRRNAKVGDLVVAFSGRKITNKCHSVQWAGVVSEVMTMGEYWKDKRFDSKKPGNTCKPDNFYALVSGDYRQIKNTTHGEKHVKRDVGGRNTLVFAQAWHFNPTKDDLPESFDLRMQPGARRGHRVSDISNVKFHKIIRWLSQQIKHRLL